LNGADKIQQVFAVDQLDCFALCELFGIGSERADANDLHCICIVVLQQAPHFADDRHLYLPGLPLLALHEFRPTCDSENQVDAAVLSASTGFLYRVAEAPESFAH